jgi:hypothetical protein
MGCENVKLFLRLKMGCENVKLFLREPLVPFFRPLVPVLPLAGAVNQGVSKHQFF